MKAIALAALLVALVPSRLALGQEARDVVAKSVIARRVSQNPLITVRSSASLGGNVNGATVIRVPDWVERPLGRYYMYFANHMGDFIRLAYADDRPGHGKYTNPECCTCVTRRFIGRSPIPWRRSRIFYTHVASPEIYVDQERRQIVLWVHGWYTNGERWPADPKAAAAWAAAKSYGQFTQAASSSDGLRFKVTPAITRTSYLRVFQRAGYFYGVSRLGRLSRSRDPFGTFELGPGLFRDGPYAGKVRHVALVASGDRLGVFFTAIGDAPERVMYATVDLSGDWNGWRASPPTDVLAPEAPFECADLPNVPSLGGDVEVPVRQIRDPFVLNDDGRQSFYYRTAASRASRRPRSPLGRTEIPARQSAGVARIRPTRNGATGNPVTRHEEHHESASTLRARRGSRSHRLHAAGGGRAAFGLAGRIARRAAGVDARRPRQRRQRAHRSRTPGGQQRAAGGHTRRPRRVGGVQGRTKRHTPGTGHRSAPRRQHAHGIGSPVGRRGRVGAPDQLSEHGSDCLWTTADTLCLSDGYVQAPRRYDHRRHSRRQLLVPDACPVRVLADRRQRVRADAGYDTASRRCGDDDDHDGHHGAVCGTGRNRRDESRHLSEHHSARPDEGSGALTLLTTPGLEQAAHRHSRCPAARAAGTGKVA